MCASLVSVVQLLPKADTMSDVFKINERAPVLVFISEKFSHFFSVHTNSVRRLNHIQQELENQNAIVSTKALFSNKKTCSARERESKTSPES